MAAEAVDASDSSEDDDEDEENTMLGFAVEPTASLLRNQFRSQLGGLPPWLDPVHLPLTSELQCRASGMPLRFVLQLYAAVNDEDPLTFHRSLYLFISPQGTLLNKPGAVRAFRCQLPRANPYYPYEPPEAADEPRGLASTEARVAALRNPMWASRARAEALGLCDASQKPGTAADPELAEVARVVRGQAYPKLELEVEPEPEDDAHDDPTVARLLQEYELREQARQQAKQKKDKTRAEGAAGDKEKENAAADAKEATAAPAPTAPRAGEGGGEEEGGKGGKGGEAEEEPGEADEEPGALGEMFGAKQTDEQEDFAMFTARVARAPEQCIRYCSDEGARPLWASRHDRAPAAIPPCGRCGAPRRFEFQVMPQMLHFMRVDSSQPEAPDWSTIAVYTCSASCAPRARVADAQRALCEPPPGAEGDEARGLRAAGTRVRFAGLQGRADLNGTTGVVISWHVEGGRWAVQRDGADESVRVKTANLHVLGEADDGAGPLLGGYAEEYVHVQMDAPAPLGGVPEEESAQRPES